MDWGNVLSSFSKSQCDHFHPFARDTMGLKQFSVEDINTVLGIFLVNDFEINSSVGIMNVNMLYVWLLQWQYVCTWKYAKLALITRWRKTLTCTFVQWWCQWQAHTGCFFLLFRPLRNLRTVLPKERQERKMSKYPNQSPHPAQKFWVYSEFLSFFQLI